MADKVYDGFAVVFGDVLRLTDRRTLLSGPFFQGPVGIFRIALYNFPTLLLARPIFSFRLFILLRRSSRILFAELLSRGKLGWCELGWE